LFSEKGRLGNTPGSRRLRGEAAPGLPSDAGDTLLVFGQGFVEALFGGGVVGVVVRGAKPREREADAAAVKPPGLDISTALAGLLINTVASARCRGLRAPASRFNGFPSAAANR
jgi:hypothetical protein